MITLDVDPEQWRNFIKDSVESVKKNESEKRYKELRNDWIVLLTNKRDRKYRLVEEELPGIVDRTLSQSEHRRVLTE